MRHILAASILFVTLIGAAGLARAGGEPQLCNRVNHTSPALTAKPGDAHQVKVTE